LFFDYKLLKQIRADIDKRIEKNIRGWTSAPQTGGNSVDTVLATNAKKYYGID
jgi:hypothetical protein